MHRLSDLGLAAAAAAILVLTSPALAQPPPAAPAAPAPVYKPTSLKIDANVPRDAKGKPVMQGVWETPFFAPLTPMPVVIGRDLVMSETDAAAAYKRFVDNLAVSPILALDPEFVPLLREAKGLPIVRGERRTRIIVQPATGQVPFTPAGQASMAGMAALMLMKADNPEERMTMERCLTLGGVPPVSMVNPMIPREFVLNGNQLVIHTEYGNELRIIPFSSAHGRPENAGNLGDSIARWEGDTLVIETTHFLARDRLRPALPNGLLVVNPNAKVIERYTRVSRDEMVYQFTVEDPVIYAAPWLGEYSLFRADYPIRESACHEGNYGLANILSGARYEEMVAREKAAAPK